MSEAGSPPSSLTSFVGRDQELAALRKALRNSRLLTLTGAGGCGKTRLAARLAEEATVEFADRVCWIDLSPMADDEKVALALGSALGVREETDRPMAETVAAELSQATALLVLDNCEHLLDACAGLSQRLLQAAPRITVLATSREPLGLDGEVVWRVPSLDEASAVQLFIERASQARPGFSPAGVELHAIAQICQRLDGIPLAIELSAARCRMMSPSQIADGLDDRFRLLTGGARTALPRQQTLETSIAWSFDLLASSEQAVLRRLAVFPGGFSLDAAEAVCADDENDTRVVADLIFRLVDKSVVQAEHGPGDSRYRLLETIRMYAMQHLLQAGESDGTRTRHCEFFLRLAERAEPELAASDGPVWLSRLEQEHHNLRTAIDWAQATGNLEGALRLVTALTLFWELRGHLAEGCRWFSRLLMDDGESSIVRARALWGAAHAAVYNDDYATAMVRAPQALEMGKAVGDDWAVARALNTLGWINLWFEPAEAVAGLQVSIEVGEKAGDRWVVADGWKMISIAWLVREEHEGVTLAVERLNQVARQLNNKFFIAWYHCCIGWIAARRGEFDVGREALEESLRLCAEVGEPATGGVAIAMLAEIETLVGEYDRAEDRLIRFLDRASVTGGAAGVPCAIPVMATLALRTGPPGRALEVLEPFLDQIRVAGLPTFLSWGLSLLGAVQLAQGQPQDAAKTLSEAKDTANSLPNHWLASLADFYLAEVAGARDDTVLAERLHHDALRRRVQGGYRPAAVESIEALGYLAAASESHEEASRLWGAAGGLRTAMGLARWPADREIFETALTAARDALGQPAFEIAFAEGAALTLEGAVAYATRARGERKRPSTGWHSLTPTELAVVGLVSQGLTNPQIGNRLFISKGTVKTHLAHIFRKLNLSSRSALATENARRSGAQRRDFDGAPLGREASRFREP